MFERSDGFFLWFIWRVFVGSLFFSFIVMMWLMVFMGIETHMDRQAILYQECGYPCKVSEHD